MPLSDASRGNGRTHDDTGVATVATQSQEAVQPEHDPFILRHLRRNFLLSMSESALFWGGWSFITYVTVAPVYVSSLTTSSVLIGLPGAIYSLGTFLPQMFVARHIQRSNRLLPTQIGIHAFSRSLLLLMAIVTFLIGASHPGLLLATFFGCYTGFMFLSGGSTPVFFALMSKVIPTRMRGQLAGWAFGIGTGLGAATALAARYILGHFPFVTNFSICFGAGAAIMIVESIVLSQVKEPARPMMSQLPPLSDYLRDLPRIVSKNRNYRMFLIGRLGTNVANMALGFFTVYGIWRFQVSEAEAGTYLFIMSIAQAVSTPILGRIADKRGHKINLELAALAQVTCIVLALLSGSNLMFYGVFALAGLYTAAYSVSNMYILMEFAAPGQVPIYVGLTNTLVAPVAFVAPLFAGWMVEGLGYSTMFVTSGIVAMLAFLVLRLLVLEPRFNPAPTT